MVSPLCTKWPIAKGLITKSRANSANILSKLYPGLFSSYCRVYRSYAFERSVYTKSLPAPYALIFKGVFYLTPVFVKCQVTVAPSVIPPGPSIAPLVGLGPLHEPEIVFFAALPSIVKPSTSSVQK